MKRTPITLSIIAAAVLGASGPALAQTNSADTGTNTTATKPLCSELGHPQAGKLADKETGRAKEHSKSPVHMDCIPDDQAGTSGSTAGTTGATGANTASSGTNATVTGSSAGTNSSITGSTSSVDSSVTGSTSTFSPSIDLRGRSSLTIDNTTSTGDQSLSSSTTTTTGDQSLSSSTSASTGDQSLSTNGGTNAATESTNTAPKSKKAKRAN